ncbi:MAG: transcription elongation factor GreA [Armatimonadetes bacterium]|nr:transcription elongation factor GreA [Armatimonadota bacterium]
MPLSIPMSAEEIERLRAELEELKTTGRRRAREELVKARSYGDFRENAEFAEAKRAQAMLEGRIVELGGILGRAQVAEVGAASCVAVGATVVVCDVEAEEEICFEVRAGGHGDPGATVVTPDSPMGQALMGKSPSDEAQVETPLGTHTYRIVSVSFAGASGPCEPQTEPG